MRQIHANEDLSGQKFTDTREWLFHNCNLTDAVFAGACEGMDIIGCNATRADWSGADTYASYWRNCVLIDAQFPSTLGYMLHHEPIAEILRRGVAESPTDSRAKVQEIYEYLFNTSRVTASWHPYFNLWGKGVGERTSLIEALHSIFAPYKHIDAKFSKVVRKLELGETLPVQPIPMSVTIEINGAKVPLDALNLPALKDVSRYTLSRWVEQQAGGHIFIVSILPPVYQILVAPDDWLKFRRAAF